MDNLWATFQMLFHQVGTLWKSESLDSAIRRLLGAKGAHRVEPDSINWGTRLCFPTTPRLRHVRPRFAGANQDPPGALTGREAAAPMSNAALFQIRLGAASHHPVNVSVAGSLPRGRLPGDIMCHWTLLAARRDGLDADTGRCTGDDCTAGGHVDTGYDFRGSGLRAELCGDAVVICSATRRYSRRRLLLWTGS
jgi:hypothetical protein